ncbi:MAG TPA: HPF/RaiA family ribosome-associated protein [Verrucomicrobiae bacterium]|nr:HPF/RaiA family ribosome-associated protein [Verrucomicrobiae bacterium]
MRLNLQHFSVRSTDALDSWVERQLLALGQLRQIDKANVRLAHHREASPAYHVRVHLVTPGPDVFVESYDHTLRAAFTKAIDELNNNLLAAEGPEQPFDPGTEHVRRPGDVNKQTSNQPTQMQNNMTARESPSDALAFLTHDSAAETHKQQSTSAIRPPQSVPVELLNAETNRTAPPWGRVEPWPHGGLNE